MSQQKTRRDNVLWHSGISSRSSSLTTICNNQWIVPKSQCNSGSIIRRSIQICTGGTCISGRSCTITLVSITAYVLHTIATSTAVERVFSQGRQPAPSTLHSKPLVSVIDHVFLCLGSGLRCDPVATVDLAEIMKCLKKRNQEDESVG